MYEVEKSASSGANVARGAALAGYGAQTAVPESAIPSAMNALVKSNDALHEVISMLADRLESVLTPQPGVPVGNDSAKPPRLSLAQQIRQQADATMSANDRLHSLLNRIEL